VARIAIASDHAAFGLKDSLAGWLREQGHAVQDLGTHGPDRVDYPDFGYRLARAIADGEAEFGVAICGSGIGISIAVNREPACRCALVELGRQRHEIELIASENIVSRR
jgi:ribose 5-phosphate isomerase B